MQNKFSLSVSAPCNEKWEAFKPSEKGAFCGSCNKNVIDFTKMSEAEILHYFRQKPSHTCGRFRPDQLKVYSRKPAPFVHTAPKWIQTGFLGLLFVLAGRPVSATSEAIKDTDEVVQLQNHREERNISDTPLHIIKGLVTDEHQEPLPGVNIYLKGSSTGVSTDIDGRFEFPEKLKEGDVLVFHFIGYETREYVVPKNAPAVIEIPMLMLDLDMVLMGEVAVDELYTPKTSGFQQWWHKVKEVF